MLLPELNRRDLDEIDPAVRKRLTIKFIDDADQLLKQAIPGIKINT